MIEQSKLPADAQKNRRKIKVKGFRRKFVDHFKDYCEHTSIHGFKYFAEETTTCEKLWWLVAIITCTTICGFMINDIFRRFIQYPVMVTFSMKETALYNIPFPSVTICPQARISQSYFNTTAAFNSVKLDVEDYKKMNLAVIACELTETKMELNEGIATEADINDFLINSLPDIMLECYFMDVEFNCSKVFSMVLTENGLCYSFNLMDKEKIFSDTVFEDTPFFHSNLTSENFYDVEDGFSSDANIDTFPFRALMPGSRNGLYVIMGTQKSDIEYHCSSEERGYKIALHMPAVIPQMGQEYFIVPLEQMVMGTIVPQLMTTSEEVKKFHPEQRDCFFQGEKPLKFFKIYTQSNCLLECLTNFTFEFCGCVSYYMPRIKNTPVCGSTKPDCLYYAERNFSFLNIESNIQHGSDLKNTFDMSCNCLPMCTDICYNLEISQNSWSWKNTKIKNRNYFTDKYGNDLHYSILNIFFKNSHVVTKERHSMYGFTDFLSNFGGLLGLFTGFSILSFVEIIYFLTIRIIGNVSLKRKPTVKRVNT